MPLCSGFCPEFWGTACEACATSGNLLNSLPIAQVDECVCAILSPEYAALELPLLLSVEKECQRNRV